MRTRYVLYVVLGCDSSCCVRCKQNCTAAGVAARADGAMAVIDRANRAGERSDGDRPNDGFNGASLFLFLLFLFLLLFLLFLFLFLFVVFARCFCFCSCSRSRS